MQVFIEVAKRDSFSAAARHLYLSTTAVSRYVRDLEDWLGVELLHRTTRRLSLTDAGQAYLERCRGIVDDVGNLERTSRDLTDNPRGTVSVTAPVFLGRRFLGPQLPGFLERYPGIRLSLQLMDRYVDLIEEGFDVGIRIARARDSGLVSRKLGEMHMVLVASPEYLARHGAPASVADLRNHNCIVDSVGDYLDRWPLVDDGRPVQLRVASNLSVNNGEMVREMALAGLGITLLPDFFVTGDLHEGKLVAVLESAVARTATISAVYPRTRHLSGTVRAFVDYLGENLELARSGWAATA
jgi:DNA-binding transcriptional LysR family regulator